jgi:hypothetical protein
VTTPGTVAICAAALMTLTVVSPAGAAPARDSRFQPSLEATVRYLQDAQREDGGFAEPGREPEADFSAWVTLALAAAGINPRDQTTAEQHHQAGHSAYTYLAEHAHEASSTTDFERELLVVDAAGTSPHDLGGVDLAGEILRRQLAAGGDAGAFAHEAGSAGAGINDTIFAILALSPIREQRTREAVDRAAQWLEEQQYCDGSWPTASPHPPRRCTQRQPPVRTAGEVDMTGAALEALNAAKRSDSERQAWAFAYLREAEAPNGGLMELLGEGEPNVASTAWGAQAMWSAGIDPETWMTGSGLASEEPLGYLASMQQPDGHIRWRQSREANGMWMSAYVGPALTGNPLPIPAAPYEPLPALPPEGSTGSTGSPSTGPGSGEGGVSAGKGAGVIAGGAGDGAPLFSRPQPRSQGHTPGGARELVSQRHERRHPARGRNPGPARRPNPGPARGRTAPTVTATAASQVPGRHGTGTARSSAEAGAKSGGAGSGTEVRGLLIGGLSPASYRHEPGAPGLRSAGAGGNQERWLTIVAYATIALLVLAGALIEHRRPRVTL